MLARTSVSKYFPTRALPNTSAACSARLVEIQATPPSSLVASAFRPPPLSSQSFDWGTPAAKVGAGGSSAFAPRWLSGRTGGCVGIVCQHGVGKPVLAASAVRLPLLSLVWREREARVLIPLPANSQQGRTMWPEGAHFQLEDFRPMGDSLLHFDIPPVRRSTTDWL